MEKSASEPIYKVIALDLARKIVAGEYCLGTKISGRSLLSSQYNVSPETIRRAISLLKAENIVNVSRGKEIVIASVENCSAFLQQQENKSSSVALYQKFNETFKRKQSIDKELNNTLDDIIAYLNYVKYSDLLNPLEIEIAANSQVIGKAINQLDFWKHTKATIVAVIQNNVPIKSPNPELILNAGDTLVVIGPGNFIEAVAKFVNKSKQSNQNYMKKAFSAISAVLLMLDETADLTVLDWSNLLSSCQFTVTIFS
jgi:K+/H+ antiporter YhaU regulatory subunit KhtT